MLLLPILFVICSIAASTVIANQFTRGEPRFATDFYQQCIQSNPGNLVVSPLSAETILALVAVGSGGNTLKQLKNVLHLSGNKCKIAKQYFNYNQLLNTSAGNVTLSVGNGAFVNEGFELNQHFKNLAVEQFSSLVEPVDFTKSNEAAQIINSYVEKETNNKITNFISPDSLNGDTRIFLVNAIDMEAKWQYKFKESDTHKGVFHSNGVEENSVDFMHMSKFFRYGNVSDLDASALEMNYSNSNFSLIIVLPNSRVGLSALEDKLNGYDLTKITHQIQDFAEQQVDVTIPKFKIESQIDLKEILQKMGLTDMFSESNANLNGISDDPLFVSGVFQKAYIEVDEEGTVAAAATGATISITSIMEPNPNTPKFNANHPFIHLIVDKTTNAVIFIGHITELK